MNKLFVVGIGPGNMENMTKACRDCLDQADIIVGYTGYTAILRPFYPEKKFFDTAMTQETERCRRALEFAEGGQIVCVVSSGDSGVYGMAGLLYELAEKMDVPTEITVIPGVTAALSGGALLGAPIGHDFVVISLSDLLTPYEVIEKRLRAAATGDFCISIYNPGSHKRKDHLHAACEILLEQIPSDRLCGVAWNIGREGETVSLMTLGELQNYHADMFSTVFIGNSQTREISGKMITPRGYSRKRPKDE